MTDSGDSARLHHSPTQPAPHHDSWPQTPSGGSAPWLTDTPYAQQITTWEGEPRQPGRPRGRRWARRIFFLLLALVPLFILLVIAAVYFEARTASPAPADAIVVLGAAQYNGNPTEVFRARLDTAYSLWNDGYAPLLVLTGGKAPGDAFTEAESGIQYLLDRGVPQSAMVFENEGRDTWASMQGVDDALADSNVESLIIVSDGFHLLRSELMARSLGYSASGAASDGSPIQPGSATEFSYAIRETGGIIVALPGLTAAWLRG